MRARLTVVNTFGRERPARAEAMPAEYWAPIDVSAEFGFGK